MSIVGVSFIVLVYYTVFFIIGSSIIVVVYDMGCLFKGISITGCLL